MGRRVRRRDERAVSAIEMSIVAPVFLLLIFVVVQASLWFYGRNVALSAAREGASHLRLAAVTSDSAGYAGYEAVAEDTALQYADGVGMLSGTHARAVIDEGSDTATMEVGGTVIDLIPGWDLDVERTLTVRVERFRPDEGPTE